MRKIGPRALLTFGLLPDIFPFTRQAQLTCDFAARAARPVGADPKAFPDTETTFAELQTRIAEARHCMASFPCSGA